MAKELYIPSLLISKRTIMILAVCLISIVASSCDGDPGPAPRRALRFQQVSSATTVPLTPAATPDISATISAAFAANTQPGGQAPVVPAEATYSVIQTNIVTGIRKSIDVRLDEEVSEASLRAIALELKSGDSRHYERTFIVYYLPGMPVGAGGWANTHFDPALEVRILGLAGPGERADVSESLISDRKDIGSWLDEVSGIQIVMYREGGKSYVEQYFRDGKFLKEELAGNPSTGGQRLETTGGSGGSHWVIDPAGNLQIRDNVGLISTAKRIK